MHRFPIPLTAALLVACADVPPLAPRGDAPPPAPEAAGAPSFARQADAARRVIPGRFIVTLKQSAEADAVIREHGLVPDYVYTRVLNGFAGSLSDAARSGLLRDARVSRIEQDVVVTTASGGTQTNAVWGLDRIDQRALPLNGTYTYDGTGAGVTVYIVDTGLRYDHVEFGGRASFGFDAFKGNGADCHGHGTHVAGTAGGRTYGVAKGVQLVSVRVLDCLGSGSGSGVIAGLDWIAKNGARPGVANLSLGGAASSALDDAIRRLHAAGVLAVVAAGNSNADACNVSPARTAEALTVGASDNRDARASFSNWGPCLDLFAPGVGITSSLHSSSTATATANGTSMAAPHVSGAAALFLERHTGAGPQQVHDGLVAETTKGIITQANSASNHLLYSLGGGAAPPPPPPPPPAENTPPTAAFAVSCAYLECAFTDQSVDSDGTITAWEWSFGGGAASTERHPRHTYAAAGTYAVLLIVTDDGGATASRFQNVTVSAPPKITLTLEQSKVKGENLIELRWTGAETAQVVVERDGAAHRVVANSGAFTDNVGKGNPRSYGYRVCETGTGECSGVVHPR